MTARILIVDDEKDIRQILKDILEDEGHIVETAAHSEEAFMKITGKMPDLVILDIWLENSDKDGIEILNILKKAKPTLPVLMISGHGNIETAVQAIKHGAYDFIEKPFKMERLLLLVNRALESGRLKSENQILKAQDVTNLKLLGKSQIVQDLQKELDMIAKGNGRVMVKGQPGAGKSLIAQMIHNLSQEPDSACIRFDGRDFDVTDFEKMTNGHFQTVILENIEGLSEDIQKNMLKWILNEGTGSGSNRVPRLITTIASEERPEDFNYNLYERLNVHEVFVPPLHKRPQDIPDLVAFFLQKVCHDLGIPVLSAGLEFMSSCQAYHWPGNAREVKLATEWAALMAWLDKRTSLRAQDLPFLGTAANKATSVPDDENKVVAMPSQNNESKYDVYAQPLRQARESFEADYLTFHYDRFEGNVARIAEAIGMERTALHRKLKNLGIGANGDDEAESSEDEKTTARQ